MGYNMGLSHCDSKDYFMQDAAGKISTIDNVSLDLYNKCKNKI